MLRYAPRPAGSAVERHTDTHMSTTSYHACRERTSRLACFIEQAMSDLQCRHRGAADRAGWVEEEEPLSQLGVPLGLISSGCVSCATRRDIRCGYVVLP